jgi:1A family penicillin-binding protein
MKRLFVVAGVLGVLLVLVGGGTFLYILQTLPSPDILADRRIPESTRIYDRSGKTLLYEIHGNEKRTQVPFEKIPETLTQATIAIEDEGFYTHRAFSIRGIIRGLIIKPLTGARAQGGSTITQQLAKNAFLTRDRTLVRKLKELALSIELERRFTKDEILSLYLNQIPYGATAYGVESASQLFFGKSVGSLTLAESALLASIPQAPTYYSPWGSHVDVLLARKDYALERMEGLGFISEEERVAATKEKLVFSDPSDGIRAPHFVLAVQDYLEQQYGEAAVRTGGLMVTTTLDWKLQELAEKAVSEGAQRNEELYNGKNAALVAEDPLTGQILALAGSRDYFDDAIEGKFNVATQGLRQPGSAIKPFVYVSAFENGYTPDTILFDVPTEFDTTGDPERSYAPENYDGLFRGPVTMRNALAQSLNIPAVKTLYLVGLDRALATAKNFGITTLTEKSRYGLSLVLGGGEVRLIDLVHAYGAFADDGITHAQSFILEVRDKEGVLESYRNKERRVMDPQYVRLVNDILSDVDARRPLFSASLSLTVVPEYEVALKTGTTNDYRDAWAIGYSPRLVAGVWAGNNDNKPMERKGGSILAAVPIWHDFMSRALSEFSSVPFVKPDPSPAAKPILRGEYVITYEALGKQYPQVHDTLFYIDRKDPQGPDPKNPETDPQFKNWEDGALAWAREHLPNFASLNEPVPLGGVLVGDGIIALTVPTTAEIVAPLNGAFVSGNVTVEVDAGSSTNILRAELYWNDALIDTRVSELGMDVHYVYSFTPEVVGPQNLLRLRVIDEAGHSAESSVILFTPTPKNP